MIYTSYADQKEELAGIKLVSCGHIFAEKGREICRPNGRKDWLLFYVAKESETFFFPKAETAEAGSVVLFAPGERQHHIHEGDKTAEFYYIHFQCEALPDGINLRTSHIYSVRSLRQLDTVFEEVIDETLQKKPMYELFCVAKLLQMLTLVQREQERIREARSSWKNVAKAIQHMNRYCDSNLSLEEYASMCCMSKYHFLRLFKETTGVTPMEYRNRIRIEHAKELLENSYASVSEIGELLGYTSAAYFSDVFKRAVGVSPAAYRKQNA